jgi:hypothetical protein
MKCINGIILLGIVPISVAVQKEHPAALGQNLQRYIVAAKTSQYIKVAKASGTLRERG